MAKLLKVGLQVPDSIPENSPVEVVYPSAYYAAAVAAGGMVQGKVGAATAGLRPLLSSDGGPLKVYGGELGDAKPPLVSVRVKPRAAGVKGIDWEHSGHPRDTGGGAWDGSKYGTVPGERMVTEAQVESLSTLLTTGQQQQAQTQAALAVVAQAGQQAVDLGTQALEQAGRIPVATFAELGNDHPNAPLGAWAYTADTRETYRKEAAGAGGWVKHGEGAASAAALTQVEASLDAVRLAPGHVPAASLGITPGLATVHAAINAQLNGNRRAVELGAATYQAAEPIVINERPLSGVRAGDTLVLVDTNNNAPAVMINSAPSANGFNGRGSRMLSDIEFSGWRNNLGDTFVPPAGQDYLYGVVHQGSHVITSNVKIRGFQNGYVFNGSHNYLNTAEHLHVWGCRNGLVFAGIGESDYGENMVVQGGAIHNNINNVVIDTAGWFTTLNNVSLDYPHLAQFFVSAPLHSFQVRGGHVEHHRYVKNNEFGNGGAGSTEYPVWLLDGPAGTDAGVLVFDGVRLVVFERPDGDDLGSNTNRLRFAERTAHHLISPNIPLATLVFRNCVDAVYGEPVNTVIIKGRVLPPIETINEGDWIENTLRCAVLVRLRLRFQNTAAERAYEVIVADKSGARQHAVGGGNMQASAAGEQTVDVAFRLEATQKFKVARVGVNGMGVEYTPLT